MKSLLKKLYKPYLIKCGPLDGRESPARLTVTSAEYSTAWTGHRKPVICITPVAIWGRIRPRHPVFVMEGDYS